MEINHMKIDGGGGKTPTKPLKKLDTFKEKDVNKDGALTGSELKGIKQLDTNQDKTISKDEFLAGKKAQTKELHDKMRDKAFDKVDKNNDGILTGNEKDKLKKFDKDGNGEITKEEYLAGRSEAWRAKVDKKFDDVFNSLDTTDEGVLSGTEMKKHKDWDADGDGQITKDEAKAGWTADRKEAIENRTLNGGKLADEFNVHKLEKADKPDKKDKKDDKKTEAEKDQTGREKVQDAMDKVF
jgi:Ca2+-binding EF-hand superfamily protein